MNRSLGKKDTFLSVFPAYGLESDNLVSQHHEQYIYNDFDKLENRKTNSPDKAFYIQKDEMKNYTEEWLKNINMMSKK
jgi:hypothetical protein